MLLKPRVMLFPDFLEYDKWNKVNEYCKAKQSAFPFIGYGSPLRWEEFTHSKDSAFKFNRSFIRDETEDDPSLKKHGDLYKCAMLTEIDDDAVKDILTHVLDYGSQHFESIENKKILRESGPWITKMDEGDYMPFHCDGPFLTYIGKTSQYSIIYYINDDYEGGEFNMPKMGLKFKPIANSVLLFTHSDNEDMAHEVLPVTSGTRYVSQSWYASMV
jgi:hypothetical protein